MVVLQQEFIPGLSYSPELDKHPSTVISYHGPFFQQSPTYPGVFERSVQYGIYTSLQNKANSSPTSRVSRQSIKQEVMGLQKKNTKKHASSSCAWVAFILLGISWSNWVFDVGH